MPDNASRTDDQGERIWPFGEQGADVRNGLVRFSHAGLVCDQAKTCGLCKTTADPPQSFELVREKLSIKQREVRPAVMDRRQASHLLAGAFAEGKLDAIAATEEPDGELKVLGICFDALAAVIDIAIYRINERFRYAKRPGTRIEQLPVRS